MSDFTIKLDGKDIFMSNVEDQYTKEQLREFIFRKDTLKADIFLMAGFNKISDEREDVIQTLFDEFGGLVYPVIDENQTIHLLDRCGNDHFSYACTYEEFLNR